METKKIAVACFIGGALCCAAALMFAPVYWWFGLFAGLAGGYVSHEFREFIQAIPVAWRTTKRDIVHVWNEASAWAKHILVHPCFGLFILSVLIAIVFRYNFFIESKEANVTSFNLWIASLILAVYCVTAFFGFFITMGICTDKNPDIARVELGIGYGKFTYTQCIKWTGKGIFQTIKFLSWIIWKYLAIGIVTGIRFLGCFAWRLFKLIHSEKRLLCAIDGTLGGALSYIWLASAATSFAGHTVLVVFGGLIGAALGVVNWEIVSKRILHVAPANGN